MKRSWVSGIAFMTSLLMTIAVSMPVGAAPRGEGGGVLTVVYDGTNGLGHMQVLERYFPATDRKVTTVTFIAADGQAIQTTADSSSGEVVCSFPEGSVTWSRASRQILRGVFESISGQKWIVLANSDGTLVSRADAIALKEALAAIGSPNRAVATAAAEFALTEGLVTPGSDGALVATAQSQLSPGLQCALASAGLAASYAGLLTCVTVVACGIAIAAHVAAVAAFADACGSALA